jgi:hypothetical protein
VADLLLTDTGHSCGVSNIERIVFIHHNKPSRKNIRGEKVPLFNKEDSLFLRVSVWESVKFFLHLTDKNAKKSYNNLK